MFASFAEILDHVVTKGTRKKLAVAAAQDDVVLESVLEARARGIVEPVLVGNQAHISDLLNDLGQDPADFQIIQREDNLAAARFVAEATVKGLYDIPMKGLLQSTDFLRALLSKDTGLVPAHGFISEVTAFFTPTENKLTLITDCGINIAPDLEQKKNIINNAVSLAKALGNSSPKVAILAPVEYVNPKIPVTEEAAILAKMAERGQIKDAIVDGPLALDNAISLEAARHKGIQSPVAGLADILVVPDLTAGNILHKSITSFARLPIGAVVLGAKCPIVMTSRTDTPQDKFNSILLAVMLSQ